MSNKIIGLVRGRRLTDRVDEYSTYYFLHIPKTAGTSFAQYLRLNYDTKDALVPQTWNELYAHHIVHGNGHDLRSYINKHRLIIGHYGKLMHRYIDGPVKTLTILRDPFDRVVSQLCHIKNEPTFNNWVRSRFILPNERITDVVEDEVRLRFFRDYQLRYLVHDFDYMHGVGRSGFQGADLLFDSSKSFTKIPSRERLEDDARKVLDKCHLVGIQEYLEETMLLLVHKSNWPPANDMLRLTSSTDPEQVKLLTDSHKEAIIDTVEGDRVIYEEYKTRFEHEYLALVNRTLGKNIKQWKTFLKNRESLNRRLKEKLQNRMDALPV